jgi:transcription elongation factor GreA
MAETYLTPEGAAKLRAELHELTNAKRIELAQRLREAIQMGDLSENADYIMAKEEQAFLEGRIQELQQILSQAQIISEKAGAADDVVRVGRTVTIREKGFSREEVYMLVGAKEANPRERKISNESPIGRAVLGKRTSDIATADTPGGKIEFEILRVE